MCAIRFMGKRDPVPADDAMLGVKFDSGDITCDFDNQIGQLTVGRGAAGYVCTST